MFEKLPAIVERYNDLQAQLADPAVTANPAEYGRLMKTLRGMEDVVEAYRDHCRLQAQLADTRHLLAGETDPDMRSLAEAELEDLEHALSGSTDRLRLLLLPRDPNDDKNVILEIRAGTGGDEASLFAAELFRMYTRYAEGRGWRVALLSGSPSAIGGFKEVIAEVEGDRVFSRLKHESGVHRVQRVPATEAAGRIHTSAVTVAILPEADEVDIQVDAKDLRIDTFCSSGPGGQSVNTTYSAVRITHLPTGLVVSCQDEKSQIKNRAKAMKVLLARLLALEEERHHQQIADSRRAMVGSGDRSEKIRTYNFPQNRVSDHRIGLTLHKLDQVMQGGLDDLLDPLLTHFQAERLNQAGG